MLGLPSMLLKSGIRRTGKWILRARSQEREKGREKCLPVSPSYEQISGLMDSIGERETYDARSHLVTHSAPIEPLESTGGKPTARSGTSGD
jgi:hypothetical protein